MASGFVIKGWTVGRVLEQLETSMDFFSFLWHIETAFWVAWLCGAGLRPNERIFPSHKLHILPSHRSRAVVGLVRRWL